MITILTTTNHFVQVENCINSVDRLNELVTVSVDTNTDLSYKLLKVENDLIISTLDWNDTEPPYILPPISFSDKNLLAIVFYKLGNHQKAFKYVSENEELHQHLLIMANLIYGYPITNKQLLFLKNTSIHNLAIIYNFGNLNPLVENNTIKNTYHLAIQEAKNTSDQLFSVKHYANFLLDEELYSDAEKLIQKHIAISTKEEELNMMNHLLSSAMLGQLSLPYDKDKLEKIASLQEQCINFYEENNLRTNAALLLIEASMAASYQNDFIKAKDLINKAILYFKQEDIPELLAEASFKKGLLLYNWSKNGSPQYYKPAINAFQDALKITKRDSHPQKFADIHHNLALIYSEIQVTEKEKPIWTAFCASSFKEALAFYTKDEFPYQFAMVSHNYATALMGFPEAKLHNNLDKAFAMFEDALSIRTAQDYPFERALTLLNQLELYWLINNKTNEDELKNYEEMLTKANEIKSLVNDKALLQKAEEQLDLLHTLKSFID